MIIAGTFVQDTQAEGAVQRLKEVGFTDDAIAKFFVNPPGQHGLFPIGGDEFASPGAEHGGAGALEGASVGSVVGAVLGAAAAPVLGPLGVAAGVGVGAYGGSLYGALNKAGQSETGHETATDPNPSSEARPDATPMRKSGLVVAVAVDDGVEERSAVDALRSQGPDFVERADGRLVDSDWVDFDPLRTPEVVG